MHLKIIPRLNFHFSFIDLMRSFKGFWKDYNDKVTIHLNSFFPKNRGVLFLNHARTGIYLILKSISLPKGARVGVMVYNCHTVFKAISFAGFNPVFIDVDDNYRISIDSLKQHANNLDALIVTHLFGISAPMDEIIEIMLGKPIIEDLAHSFLVEKDGEKLGSFGDAAVVSFGQSKFPSAGQGGFVLFNSDKVYKKAKKSLDNIPTPSLINNVSSLFKAYFISILMNKYIYGLITYKLKTIVGDQLDINKKFEFPIYQVNPFFLAVLNDRLVNIENDLSRQESNSKYLWENVLWNKSNKMTIPFFKIPIKVDFPEKLLSQALDSGLEIGMHFSKSIEWAKEYGYKNGVCANAELLIKKTITIPCHYNLEKSSLVNYVNFINKNIIYERE